MSISEIIWIAFLLIAIQPLVRQKLLDAMRRRWIGAVERKRNSRVVLMVHRQETMSLLGFPIVRYIDMDDSEDILRAIQMTDPKMPLDLVLHTPGGLVLASLQIARAIHHYPGKVTVFVPHMAMSGGTLIALAADEIVLSPHAVLGPVDPQLGEYPAASLIQAVERKPVARVDDKTLILADQARKAMTQLHANVKELLTDKLGPEKAEELAGRLAGGEWTHDHPITAEEAKAMGLPVVEAMPPEIMRLMSLFPQPVRRHPSVEYIPQPRKSAEP